MKTYLITTDSITLLSEKISELIPSDSNKITYDMNETSITDILEEASYVSMFLDMKYVVVKNADFFGKKKLNDKDTDLLSHYLDNPYPYTTLIFTTYEDIDKRKALTKKIITSNGLIALASPKNYDLFLEIKKKTQKYHLSDQAVKYLIQACLNNYDLIINEIKKLALFNSDTITYKDITKIVAANASDNVFKFTDAVINKNLEEAITTLEDLLTLKTDVLQLLNLLTREYRLMYYYKIYERKQFSWQQILTELKLQDWQGQKIMKESLNYHEDDLKDLLISLSMLDYKIKSGRYDKNIAMYQFLIQNLGY